MVVKMTRIPLLKKLIWVEWVKIFVVVAGAFFLLYSVGELVASFINSSKTAAEIFFRYLFSLPTALSYMVPFACLIASLFALNRLRDRSELIAIFAGGFSRSRFYHLDPASCGIDCIYSVD